MRAGFYEDERFCSTCAAYVRYLLALEDTYCAQCGGRTALFSLADWAAFSRSDPSQGEGLSTSRASQGEGDWLDGPERFTARRAIRLA